VTWKLQFTAENAAPAMATVLLHHLRSPTTVDIFFLFPIKHQSIK